MESILGIDWMELIDGMGIDWMEAGLGPFALIMVRVANGRWFKIGF